VKIPFNKPYMTGKELDYIKQAHELGHLSGEGIFTQKCHRCLEENLHCKKVFLTTSGTTALEMAAILADIQTGDEVIMPSYTFPSTANAFVLRGARVVFVDIRPDTMNIDEMLIEQAVTNKTKAIVPVHYAGVACEMDTILKIANKHNILVIEDAAHGFLSTYKGKYLGTIGDIGCFSFHETKNITCGEGGAIILNNERFIKRAEIVREKGTNRCIFFRGEVDKYTWVDIGSSYLPSEINAAFLWAQLEEAESITRQRLRIWEMYHDAFGRLEDEGKVRRPITPPECQHNAHMYYLLLPDLESRTTLLKKLQVAGICAIFHYVPLHSSPAGIKYGRVSGQIAVTDNISERILRLPLYYTMLDDDIEMVVKTVEGFFRPR
jgi:dTDP-4-amino-4,6-dideoxygalactose transaminase